MGPQTTSVSSGTGHTKWLTLKEVAWEGEWRRPSGTATRSNATIVVKQNWDPTRISIRGGMDKWLLASNSNPKECRTDVSEKSKLQNVCPTKNNCAHYDMHVLCYRYIKYIYIYIGKKMGLRGSELWTTVASWVDVQGEQLPVFTGGVQ